MPSRLCSEWTQQEWQAANSNHKGNLNKGQDLCGRISHQKRKTNKSTNNRIRNNSKNRRRRKITIKLKRKKIWEILLIKIGISRKPFNIMIMLLISTPKKFCITITKLQYILN
jgi:hypothetical protein